uniref:Reverse transcriptase domain-containing protein n=1 Tax=Anguilla anguilla TaxID=7936 RepID=A0A0E9QKN3_ANGAN
MLTSLYSHLETIGSMVKIMVFFIFLSAFNTLKPHIFANKLINLNLHKSIIGWILHYLTSRPQYVRINNQVSESIFN